MKLYGLALGLVLIWGRAEVAEKLLLDPEMPYQAERRNPVGYEVDFSVGVTPPAKTKVLRVWLPLLELDFVQEITEKTLSTFPMEVKPTIAKEPVFGNKFAYLEHFSRMQESMCHFCASRNPGLFPRKREPRKHGVLFLSGFPLSRDGHPLAGFASLWSRPLDGLGRGENIASSLG